MGQCVGRAAEEEGGLGQSRVQRGRSVRRPGVDAEPTQLRHLLGREAERAGDHIGIAVEPGRELGVDSQPGHGIAIGVVAHTLTYSVGLVH